ncbi:uncharacterized protein K489DRAFT_376063 [Dissoconium aciculare CBS 342.82]|uniref:Uncharacterized protein n=1 Tax=Dissoconium aciculare CBS 342.82 TaxID=1314786 RepID=A0A6J3MJ46_9PEZI|nr:uncharacterized protein K489DRAFT_376063 [Dissoconium aciculare CBS 342.82]KAF1827905.1 hypothetical protein K489DRAFT_376063 [Dissoconium aciculare CBS 342.82]
MSVSSHISTVRLPKPHRKLPPHQLRHHQFSSYGTARRHLHGNDLFQERSVSLVRAS